MTKKELNTGNKLIQQWLYENVGIGFWSNEPLNFYNDYSWIMPVVERIEDKTEAAFVIYKRTIVCNCNYNEWQLNKERNDLIIDIPFNRGLSVPFEKLHAIYKCVVEYIVWSNKQKNINNRTTACR